MKCTLRLVLALAALGGMLPARAGEFRGLYVDAFHPGFKTHQEVTQMVGGAKAANVNALIVQVRKRGDAYYNSKIEPKASDIAADYDPLADIIRRTLRASRCTPGSHSMRSHSTPPGSSPPRTPSIWRTPSG